MDDEHRCALEDLDYSRIDSGRIDCQHCKGYVLDPGRGWVWLSKPQNNNTRRFNRGR
jgi:hypothetical protein